jgi:divalent metal cation (Fe/Co/Zn/Cd) transporter
MSDSRLFRLLWLAVAAAVATIALKTTAWALTGSVGLLSDAAESVVNLVAALVALAALRWAIAPADEEHAYGHTKAEYFSAGVEGALVLVAAVAIAITATSRLLHPTAIEDVGVGLAVSTGASAINLAVGLLHPIIALAVAANIVWTGVVLMRRSLGGLMDRAVSDEEQQRIRLALRPFELHGVRFHALRTRQAGRRAFISVHVLVPRAWTVQRAHDEVERVEDALRDQMPYATVFTHLEPLEDPRSYDDTRLDRQHAAAASEDGGGGAPHPDAGQRTR